MLGGAKTFAANRLAVEQRNHYLSRENKFLKRENAILEAYNLRIEAMLEKAGISVSEIESRDG
jgi:hypothetical protein